MRAEFIFGTATADWVSILHEVTIIKKQERGDKHTRNAAAICSGSGSGSDCGSGSNCGACHLSSLFSRLSVSFVYLLFIYFFSL